MKTIEVSKDLIGKRCECIFTGMMVTGVIEDTEENEYKVRFDHPHQWGDDFYTEDWAWGRKSDEFGTLHHLRLLEDKPDFQTMIVVFGEPISQIDRSVFEDADTCKPDFQTMIVVFGEPISQIDRSVFEDADTWGVCSLQGWVNSYESVRFVAINDHTAVITGEYNFEQVKEWLEKHVPIKSLEIIW